MTDPMKDAFDKASTVKVSSRKISDDLPISPLQSMIQVEFESGVLPVGLANMEVFMQLMNEKIKAKLSDDIQMILLRNKINPGELTIKELDKLLPVKIMFEDGMIEYDNKGKRNYVQISSISVSGRGSIAVGGYGTSDDAEKALGKCYECIFEAAGMKSQWAEARENVIAKGYATSTIETIDCSLNNILASRLADVFNANTFNEKGFTSKIGTLPLNPETGEPFKRNRRSTLKLGSVNVDVIRYDDDTGDRYETTIKISPKTTADAGLGRYVIMSEFEYNTHKEFVSLIKAALKE